MTAREIVRIDPLRALLALSVFAVACSGCGRRAPGPVLPITILVSSRPFTGVSAAATGEERVNWRDGDDRDDDACTESFAAVELRRVLARSLGVTEDSIRIEPPERLPLEGDVFVIGSRRSNPLIAALMSRAVADSSRDAFHLRAIGRGGRTLFVIEGASRTGTLYGVYAFAERLGFRFFGLGENGTIAPRAPVAWPRDLRVDSSPAFETRGFWAWEKRGSPEFFLWMARNRMNLWTVNDGPHALLAKLGIRLAGGGHEIQHEFLDPRAEYPYDHPRWRGDESKPRDPYAPGPSTPRDLDRDGRLTYFEAHPEWFGLHGGKRSADLREQSGDNYCTSNVDATRELARKLANAVIGGDLRDADVVNVWMLDQGRWCECDACRAQGTPTDRSLIVLKAVSDAIEEARREGRLKRDVALAMPAYLETLSPPTRPLPDGFDYRRCTVTFFPYFRCYAHALADPGCTEINHRLSDAYSGWTEKAERHYQGAVGIGEYYNVSYIKSLPVVFPHVMSVDIRHYHDAGARSFHYMHAPTSEWGTWTLEHHVLATLLWNPGADVDSLIRDYCERYYPAAASPMKSFYARLETATANILALEHCAGVFAGTGVPHGRLAARNFPVFPLRHLQPVRDPGSPNDAPSLEEIEQAMREARSSIDSALIAARDTVERERLAEDERRFRYGERVFALYSALIRTAVCDHAGAAAAARRAFAPVDSLTAELSAMTDVVQVAASHANARNAYDASQVVSTCDYFRQLYGAPRRPH
jgi:hypothetical protein